MSASVRPLHIALLGTRGIPARYGGFETFAEELSTRLAARGHRIVVYGRRPFGESYEGPLQYDGVEIRVTPTIMHKYLETPLHALVSFFDLIRRRPEVVLLCNAANSPFAFIVRLLGLPLVINVDGIERRRKKWNALGRLWYLLGEYCSVLFASRVVADAQVIADYYRERYGASSEVIAYGAKAVCREGGETLAKFALAPRQYLLYVSRLEPENNALGVIEAYREARELKLPLVVVGDAPYASEYKARLRAAADERVIFTGYQFGSAYQELQSNCYLYIQATEVGGTHPALIEAMAYGNCVIANGTPENREVLGEAGCFYEVNRFSELALLMRQLAGSPDRVRELGVAARARAEARYRWEAIADQYEQLLDRVRAGQA